LILMDLTFPPEAEAFRERLRRFLRDNLPPDSCCCRQTNPASRSGRSGRSPGHAEFFEFFFTDATASTDHVIGGVNNGWKTAVSLLGSNEAPPPRPPPGWSSTGSPSSSGAADERTTR
jgi:hypothetical protein